MLSIDASLSEINTRAAIHRQKKNRRSIGTLSALSAVLAVAALVSVSVFSRAAPVVASRPIYGSIFLAEGAGGYVLAGVLAFMAGVVITVLCIRHKEKKKQSSDKKD